jgi:hypothetical protein
MEVNLVMPKIKQRGNLAIRKAVMSASMASGAIGILGQLVLYRVALDSEAVTALKLRHPTLVERRQQVLSPSLALACVSVALKIVSLASGTVGLLAVTRALELKKELVRSWLLHLAL